MFQSIVSSANSLAVAGDWASSGPRRFYLSSGGLIVADDASQGIRTGFFAFRDERVTSPHGDDGAPLSVSSKPTLGSPDPIGLVHREQQSLLQWSNDLAGEYVPTGSPISIATSADLYVNNWSPNESVIGWPVWCRMSDGAPGAYSDSASPAGWRKTRWFCWSVADGGGSGLMKISDRSPLL